MSVERPGRGQLKFQCDVCYDDHLFSKSDGDDVSSFQACWIVLRDDGWTMNSNEHMCPDCSKIAKAERDNPFRR